MANKQPYDDEPVTITMTYREAEYLRNLLTMPYFCARMSVFPYEDEHAVKVEEAYVLYKRVYESIYDQREHIRGAREPEAAR